MWLNLNQVKTFLVIHEEGSLTAAAKKLRVGQPALSAQLKLLEESLGMSLFRRENRKLHLTPEGEVVLKYARTFREVEDELLSAIAHPEKNPRQELLVAAQESVPKGTLAEILSRLLEHGLRFKVVEGTGAELFELISAGKADLFIGNFRPHKEDRIMSYQSISREAVSVWGAKKFSHLRKGFPNSMMNHAFVLPGFQNQLRHDFESFMLTAGIDFSVSVEAQDTALLKELAARGAGLVIQGNESIQAWVKAGRLIMIGELPRIKEEYWLGVSNKTIDANMRSRILGA